MQIRYKEGFACRSRHVRLEKKSDDEIASWVCSALFLAPGSIRGKRRIKYKSFSNASEWSAWKPPVTERPEREWVACVCYQGPLHLIISLQRTIASPTFTKLSTPGTRPWCCYGIPLGA